MDIAIIGAGIAGLTRLRFGYGSDNFLQLLDTERSKASARAALAQGQADRADAQIRVFKVFGGGWEAADAIPIRRITP